MIISGGKNIYPREIGEVIYTHEAVLEAAVIGVPDDYWGESVKAYVILKEGMKVTEQEIIDLCKQTIASYKKPRSVEFVRQLPKSPTGKILKRVMRDNIGRTTREESAHNSLSDGGEKISKGPAHGCDSHSVAWQSLSPAHSRPVGRPYVLTSDIYQELGLSNTIIICKRIMNILR